MNYDFSFLSSASAEEKAAFSAEALQAVSELVSTVPEREGKLARLEEENASLKSTVERARKLYGNMKDELAGAEQKTKKSLYKKLQVLRDRIYVIGDIASAAGGRLSSKGAGMTPEEINNVIASLETMIDQLKENGLWEEDDVMPPLIPCHPKAAPPVDTAEEEEFLQASLFDGADDAPAPDMATAEE